MKRLVYGELCLQLARSPFGGKCREAARKNPGWPEKSWGKISSAVFLPPIKTCFVITAKEHSHGNG